MLTKIIIRNFKRFDDVTIELGDPVVFIGPNNSGKTTALQAFILWSTGIRKWQEKRTVKSIPGKLTGVTINRQDLNTISVPNANLLWRNHYTRERQKTDLKITRNIRIEILAEGITGGKKWECGLEFDYANPDSFFCRPLSIDDHHWMPVPDEAGKITVAYLPPMSGLAAQEPRLDTGAINVRIGEGRTAEVLRNLCYRMVSAPANPTISQDSNPWNKIQKTIEGLFGVHLNTPLLIPERNEIEMNYTETGSNGIFDLSAAGRGLHQTLLLLVYLYSNPGSVLLLDEPDAHLEITRQRQMYQILIDTAREQGCQIIAASHSEVILNEAAERDTLIAFLGSKPHRIDNRGALVKTALRDIGFEQYYLAESKGWVLYLEGSTDLAILKAFAETLGHPARKMLDNPFVNYRFNQPSKVRENFYRLKDAKMDLVGIALFDRIDSLPQEDQPESRQEDPQVSQQEDPQVSQQEDQQESRPEDQQVSRQDDQQESQQESRQEDPQESRLNNQQVSRLNDQQVSRQAIQQVSRPGNQQNTRQEDQQNGLTMFMWKRREIENYLCYPEVLLRYALGEGNPDLFRFRNQDVMSECISDLVDPVALKDQSDRWWADVKASDDFLDRLFEMYFKRLDLPNVMQKNNYHQLARLVPKYMIDEEIIEKLNKIVSVAQMAHGA